ncbi:hypothetical protein QBC40DRAFT_189050, partial [Triangularia verruculosa]
ILAVILVVYRPIILNKLPALVDMPNYISRNDKALTKIVGLCDSFPTLCQRTISFIYQSAKDFLLGNGMH